MIGLDAIKQLCHTSCLVGRGVGRNYLSLPSAESNLAFMRRATLQRARTYAGTHPLPVFDAWNMVLARGDALTERSDGLHRNLTEAPFAAEYLQSSWSLLQVYPNYRSDLGPSLSCAEKFGAIKTPISQHARKAIEIDWRRTTSQSVACTNKC